MNIAVLENQNAPDAASSKSAPREGLLHDFSEQEILLINFGFRRRRQRKYLSLPVGWTEPAVFHWIQPNRQDRNNQYQ